MNPDQPALHCEEFVELVTAYLDDALPDAERARVDHHLEGCEGCSTVLAQWRSVIALSGRLTEADVDNTDEYTRDRLLSTLRSLRRR